MANGMGIILEHFGFSSDPSITSALMRSALLTRYSKAPEYEYTPGLREELIDRSRRINRAEIHRGMTWLERVARSDNAAATVVNAMAR